MAEYFEQGNKYLAKQLQKGIGAKIDGLIGNQTILNIALEFEKQGVIELEYPFELKIYDGFLIVAKPNQIHFDYARYSRDTNEYEYATNGTFFSYKTNRLVSILADDTVYHGEGSKVYKGKAEGVIYLDENSNLRWRRFIYYSEINNPQWAISGVSLHDYHPTWEGFVDDEGSLRYAWHTVLGYKDNLVYLFVKKGRASQLAKDVTDNLKLDAAIMLDGGSMCSINTPTIKYNVHTNQNNMVVIK